MVFDAFLNNILIDSDFLNGIDMRVRGGKINITRNVGESHDMLFVYR